MSSRKNFVPKNTIFYNKMRIKSVLERGRQRRLNEILLLIQAPFLLKWRMIMAERIAEHPILGVQEKGALVTFTFDGREVTGYEGEPIAAALKAAGVMVHRYTKKEHKPRGIFCAIGRCTDCVMVVDGVPNVRTCITPLKAGMEVKTQYGVSDQPFEKQ